MIELYEGNGTPIKAVRIGRNDKCQCGSGRKAKNCCGTATRYFVKEKEKKNQLEGPQGNGLPYAGDNQDEPLITN
jgi:hypothetical protein